MSKAGKRLIDAATEAVAVAKGEQPAAAIYHKGHKYVPASELEMLTTAGIIEVAIRNPSVMEYMRHWEGRAEKAEANLSLAVEALERIAADATQVMAKHDPGTKNISGDEANKRVHAFVFDAAPFIESLPDLARTTLSRIRGTP
jgi:hypothetical protein